MAGRWLRQNILSSQKTPYSSTVRVSYGVFIVRKSKKIDCVVTAQHYIYYLFQTEEKYCAVDVCDTMIIHSVPQESPVRLVMLDAGIATSISEKDMDNFKAVFIAVILGEVWRMGLSGSIAIGLVILGKKRVDKKGYRKISNMRRTKSQNLNDYRLVLQLSLPNPLKPVITSRMKM